MRASCSAWCCSSRSETSRSMVLARTFATACRKCAASSGSARPSRERAASTPNVPSRLRIATVVPSGGDDAGLGSRQVVRRGQQVARRVRGRRRRRRRGAGSRSAASSSSTCTTSTSSVEATTPAADCSSSGRSPTASSASSPSHATAACCAARASRSCSADRRALTSRVDVWISTHRAAVVADRAGRRLHPHVAAGGAAACGRSRSAGPARRRWPPPCRRGAGRRGG